MSDVYLPEFLKQKAVYWAESSTDRYGNKIYGDVVEIKCRWDDVHEEFLDMAGNRQVSNATVMVDRELEPGGVLWRGALESLVDPGIPFNNTDAYTIQKFESSPDLSGKKFVRTAIL